MTVATLQVCDIDSHDQADHPKVLTGQANGLKVTDHGSYVQKLRSASAWKLFGNNPLFCLLSTLFAPPLVFFIVLEKMGVVFFGQIWYKM